MHVELVELLRCVQPHEETWLVASIDRIDDREIVSGTLGCPICHAEYAVRDRVVYVGSVPESPSAHEPDVDQAVRIAAALDLTDARAIAVLHGPWASHARLVRSLSPVQLMAINPPDAVEGGDGVNVVRCDVAPLARRSCHGVAVGPGATPALVASLVAALRPGGRMVAPVDLSIPPGLTELARDTEIWVAEHVRDDVIPIRRTRNAV